MIVLLFCVEFGLLLVINVHGQYVGTLSLEYSLEGNNRIFACPLESVSLTCSINGTLLIWEAGDGNTTSMKERVGFFRQNDIAGNGFSTPENFNCHGEMLFSGVLDYIGPAVNNVSVCTSSMIIRPLSMDASSDCGPLIIVCKPSDQEPEATKNVTYQVAARPIAPGSDPDNSVCTYQQLNSQYCLFHALINVTNVLNNNKDTEVSYVSLRALGEGEISHINFSISPTTQIWTLNTTFHCSSPNIPIGINMFLTVIDKCGQHSETVTQSCMRLNSEPQGQSSSDKITISLGVPLGIALTIALGLGILLAIIGASWCYLKRKSKTINISDDRK